MDSQKLFKFKNTFLVMTISVERAKRYKEKLELIDKRTGEIEAWLPKLEKTFLADEKTKLAIYKAFQELTESALDVMAVAVKDIGKVPKDDYSNLELLKGKVISETLAKVLAEASGLRNVLVHRYNSVEDARAFHVINTLLPKLKLKEVQKWLASKI